MKTTNCTQIEALLPLHAGGDLPGREAAQVEAHLTGCTDCRAELADLRESQAWLAGLAANAPAFADAQLVRMRARVLAEIQRDQQQPACPWLASLRPARLAFAGLALLLALGALAFSLRRATAPDELIALPLAPEQRIVPEERFTRPPSAGVKEHSPNVQRHTAWLRHATRRTAAPPSDFALAQAALPGSATLAPIDAGAAPAPEPLRIEIQTADPNIRIIWLASSADEASLHSPTTK